MAFSQAGITDQRHVRVGGELVVTWASTAPAGTTFQLYVGGRLAWWGTEHRARIAAPNGPTAIEVGTVGSGEHAVDFSGSLPAAPACRARLTWTGGTYLAETLVGYRVHGETAPGAGIDANTPIAFVPAYRGATSDGYGHGGYGHGGYGASAASYAWISPPLAPGEWDFAVVPVDRAGNVTASPTTTTITIAGPPRPPAATPNGRLRRTYDAGTRVATLQWTASPAFVSPLDPNAPE